MEFDKVRQSGRLLSDDTCGHRQQLIGYYVVEIYEISEMSSVTLALDEVMKFKKCEDSAQRKLNFAAYLGFDRDLSNPNIQGMMNDEDLVIADQEHCVTCTQVHKAQVSLAIAGVQSTVRLYQIPRPQWMSRSAYQRLIKHGDPAPDDVNIFE